MTRFIIALWGLFALVGHCLTVRYTHNPVAPNGNREALRSQTKYNTKSQMIGWTELARAAYRGEYDKVTQMLQDNGDPNEVTLGNGWSPLMYAAQNGDVEVIEALLAHDASALLLCDDDLSAMRIAHWNGHKAAEMLLTEAAVGQIIGDWEENEAAADPFQHSMATYLGGASRYRNRLQHQHQQPHKVMPSVTNGTEAASSNNVNTNAGDGNSTSDDRTNLSSFVDNGSVAFMLDAIRRGNAPVDTVNTNGWSPLLAACSVADEQLVHTLVVTYGANVHLADRDGWTCLMFAAHMDAASLARRLLQEYGASATARARDGQTARNVALANGSRGVLRVLWDHTAAVVTAKATDDATKRVFSPTAATGSSLTTLSDSQQMDFIQQHKRAMAGLQQAEFEAEHSTEANAGVRPASIKLAPMRGEAESTGSCEAAEGEEQNMSVGMAVSLVGQLLGHVSTAGDAVVYALQRLWEDEVLVEVDMAFYKGTKRAEGEGEEGAQKVQFSASQVLFGGIFVLLQAHMQAQQEAENR